MCFFGGSNLGNLLLNDSDSDDDFEIIVLLALEEEQKERGRQLHIVVWFQAIGSSNIIMSKATKDFFKTILQIHQYILLIYFGGGFE